MWHIAGPTSTIATLKKVGDEVVVGRHELPVERQAKRVSRKQASLKLVNGTALARIAFGSGTRKLMAAGRSSSRMSTCC